MAGTVQLTNGNGEVLYQQLVRRRIRDHLARVDVLSFGHEDDSSTYPVHELDGDNALLERRHHVPLLQHGVVEVSLASYELTHLFSRDVLSLHHCS